MKKHLLTCAVAIAGLAWVPATSTARGARWTDEADVSPPCSDNSAVHATRGVVKSIDATTLVITRTGNRGDLVLKLGPGVYKEGAIVVGAVVSVRYHDEGRVHVATAVALQRTIE